MTTPVNFELAKLLKEKEFDKPLPSICFIKEESNYTSTILYEVLDMDFEYILRPTIAEVVMWLYEKYGVWISVNFANKNQWYFDCNRFGFDGKEKRLFQSNYDYNSPTEAYEVAIKYILENIVK